MRRRESSQTGRTGRLRAERGLDCLQRVYPHALLRADTADESLDHLFAGAKSFSDGSGPHDDVTAVVLKVPMEPQAVSVKSNPEGVASLDNNLESSSELPVCAAISL